MVRGKLKLWYSTLLIAPTTRMHNSCSPPVSVTKIWITINIIKKSNSSARVTRSESRGLKGLQLELLQCRIYIVEVWMVAAWWICIRIWQKRCFAAIYQKQISASQLDIFRQGGGGGGLGSISIRQITSQAVWLSQLADSALKARARPWWQSTASGAILLRGHLTRCLYPGCM